MNMITFIAVIALFTNDSSLAKTARSDDSSGEKMQQEYDFNSRFSKTPAPPYYTVLFTIQSTGKQSEAFNQADQRMLKLAKQVPGYIGSESLEDDKGFILMMTYWENLEAIRQFRENAEHRDVQEKGKALWFQKHVIRVAKVIKEYGEEM